MDTVAIKWNVIKTVEYDSGWIISGINIWAGFFFTSLPLISDTHTQKCVFIFLVVHYSIVIYNIFNLKGFKLQIWRIVKFVIFRNLIASDHVLFSSRISEAQSHHRRHHEVLKYSKTAKFCYFLVKVLWGEVGLIQLFPEMGSWQIWCTMAFY